VAGAPRGPPPPRQTERGEEFQRREKIHTEEKKLRWSKGERFYEDRKKKGEEEK
jgi:hypothetical protein